MRDVLTRFSPDPWDWAHLLTTRGIAISRIDDALAAELVERFDVGPWRWIDPQGIERGGMIYHYRLTKAGKTLVKEYRDA